MPRLFAVMGKSSSGKDSIFQELVSSKKLSLKKVIPYTTRPARKDESSGTEYFFTDIDGLKELEAEGKIVEHRYYETMHGTWHYFTVDDGQIDLEKFSYIMITTPAGFEKLCAYYGREVVVPIYIEVEDGIRLERALERERTQKNPRYAELCRRFLADEKDFSEEYLSRLGIIKRYRNIDRKTCISQIADDILANL